MSVMTYHWEFVNADVYVLFETGRVWTGLLDGMPGAGAVVHKVGPFVVPDQKVAYQASDPSVEGDPPLEFDSSEDAMRAVENSQKARWPHRRGPLAFQVERIGAATLSSTAGPVGPSRRSTSVRSSQLLDYVRAWKATFRYSGQARPWLAANQSPVPSSPPARIAEASSPSLMSFRSSLFLGTVSAWPDPISARAARPAVTAWVNLAR